MITVESVKTKGDYRKFFTFPIQLYKDQPYYIPSLLYDEKWNFNPKKNPAYEFCETICFLAREDGKVVGRIAGLINHNINKAEGSQTVRFTRFDVIDNLEVSRQLIEAVAQWGQNKGMDKLIGPMGFSDLDKQGLLVEGFDQPGMFITTYNFPYYKEHLEALGFQKEVDWVEFKIEVPEQPNQRIERLCEIAKKRQGYKLLNFRNKKEVIPYAYKMFEMYNEAFAPLYGYAPLNQAQIEMVIKQFISLVSLEYVFVVVNSADDVIGFGIMVPSLSEPVRKSKGRLLPLGWWRIMRALKHHEVLDMYLIAVKPSYAGRGVNAVIMNEGIKRAIANGVKYAETGPELEDNANVQTQWDAFHTERHKRRRCYSKAL
ncbi:MAG: N-acetyltransferase [Spirochaetota bacterium]